MANYRARVRGSLPGESYIWGLHLNGSAGAAAAALTAWAAAISAFWNDVTDGCANQFSADISIDAIDVAELDPVTGKQLTRVEQAFPQVGTAAGDMLPHEVSCAVATRTAVATRAGRGRFYLPPPAVSTVLNGRFTATFRNQVGNATALMVNDLQGAAFNPVILHPNQTSTAITSIDVGDVPDVQKRRRNKLIEVRTVVGV